MSPWEIYRGGCQKKSVGNFADNPRDVVVCQALPADNVALLAFAQGCSVAQFAANLEHEISHAKFSAYEPSPLSPKSALNAKVTPYSPSDNGTDLTVIPLREQQRRGERERPEGVPRRVPLDAGVLHVVGAQRPWGVEAVEGHVLVVVQEDVGDGHGVRVEADGRHEGPVLGLEEDALEVGDAELPQRPPGGRQRPVCEQARRRPLFGVFVDLRRNPTWGVVGRETLQGEGGGGRELLEGGGGAPPQHSGPDSTPKAFHTPIPAPTAFPTASNRPPNRFTSPVTALQPLWNFPRSHPSLSSKALGGGGG